MANEVRLRVNNVSGAINDNPLLVGATTANSPQFADLPVVDTTNHLIITLDPLEVYGAAEVVKVTAHTSLATSVTVVRGQDGTVARQHPLGTTWFHGPVVSDYNFTDIAALSTNRPATPTVGQLIYETDTDSYVGRGAGPVWQTVAPLGAWTSYTPSNTNVTVGNGTQTAFWIRHGRMITVRYSLVWGTTTSFGGVVEIGLPVAAVTGIAFGSGCSLLDDSTTYRAGIIIPGVATGALNANKALVTHDGAAPGKVDATNPFTWTNPDRISACFTYEAAS